MNGQGKKLEGVKAIADFLGVNEATIWRWLRREDYRPPILKCGGRYHAWEADLRQWMVARAA